MTYGTEAIPVKKVNKKRLKVTKMRMLRWTCRVTRRGRISNAIIGGIVKVVKVSKKA